MKKYLLLAVFFTFLLNSGFSQDPLVSVGSQSAIGSTLIDNAVHTVIDSEGNRIVYGTFSEEIDFDQGVTEFIVEPLGSPDIFLASYSADGSLNWAFNLGRIGLNDGMTAHGLGVDSENNVIISGGFSLTVDFDPSTLTSNLTAVQGQDGFVAKYDPMAQLVWVKQFGGTGSDLISAMAIDDQDNKLIGVRFGGEIDLDPSEEGENLVTPVGGLDAAVVKLDADGNFDWSYLVAPDVNNEAVSALAVNANGDVAMGALVKGVTTGIPVQSMLAGVLNSDGTEQWSYDFQNQGQANAISHISFSEDEANIYLGGRIQEDTDFDPSVNEEIISPLFADPFISKHSTADGSLAWAKYVESSSTADHCAGVHENNGVVFLAGSFDVLATFVPGDFGTQIPSNGASDVFVSVYEAESGDFVDAETFGGVGGERANDAFFAGAEGMVIVGQFSSSLGLVEGEVIDAEGFEDAFFAEFSYAFDLSAGIELSDKNINLYPVPAIDQVFVQLKDITGNSVEIKVINIIGQTIFEGEYNDPTQKIKLDISNLNQGVYLVEIRVNGSSITKRLIKQ
ncbi:T9SS type A sorting domain-containing protein [Cryomorphaceae bacterium 1068]|nr:T9SS type A sorting domain-containing protein [Cryomorphaceae bacterium 1068]